ncbi:MAG: efflux RND transporter periplasmic adaptor subunit [Pseudomonadota bacterium]
MMQLKNLSVTAAILALLAMPFPALAQSKLVKLAEVEADQGLLERTFFGRVRAKQTIDLAFQVGGQIFELPVDEGQAIAEGDLIAQLDLEPFELTLALVETELADAEADFVRLSALAGSAVSQVAIDDAETNAQIKRIEKRDAERSLRLATMTSPFDGIIAQRSVPNFTTISAGTPVVRLHDMSDLRVEIEVPEVLFQQAGTDPNVQLLAEFAASPKLYEMEFREVVAETNEVGQAFTITLGMEPPDDLFLLPGASATVYARFTGQDAPIIIPSSAVVFDPDGSTYVMTFEPAGADAGTVSRQAIEITPNSFGNVQVLSGLEPGMEIVAAGAALLEDGDAVERFSGFSR